MKLGKTLLRTALTLVGFVSTAHAFSDRLPVPRGPVIEPLAGNCQIGPHPQTSKAGHYNQFCNKLTDAEKCAAYIKQHLDYQTGEMEKTRNPEKAQYCIDTFLSKLF